MAKQYRKGEILIALFNLLKNNPDGFKPSEAIEELAKILTLTEEEKGKVNSGQWRFDRHVRFHTVDAAKAGLIVKDGTAWIITEAGLDALAKYSTPAEMQRYVQQRYQQWKQTATCDESEEKEDMEKDSSVTYDEALEQAQESINAFLHKMPPFDFQKLVAELLNAMGCHVIWNSPPGKDGGTDILAYTDPLGIQGPRIKAQVKQQQKSVSEPELKSFVANIGPHDSGIYFCTGGFTQDAHKYARQQENKRIMLVDSQKLVELWIANMRKLSDQAWQRLPLTPIYFLTLGN